MIDLKLVKQYLNIPSDYTDEDTLLDFLLYSAKKYVSNYTGNTTFENIPDLELATIQIVSSSYNNRDYESENKLTISKFTKSILDMHSENLV